VRAGGRGGEEAGERESARERERESERAREKRGVVGIGPATRELCADRDGDTEVRDQDTGVESDQCPFCIPQWPPPTPLRILLHISFIYSLDLQSLPRPLPLAGPPHIACDSLPAHTLPTLLALVPLLVVRELLLMRWGQEARGQGVSCAG